MRNDEICDLIDQIDALLQTAESGEDWAEIVALEAILVEAERRCREDHGQFGVGA